MAERRYKHFATFFPTNKITLEDVFLVFRRKIESRLTANYKWHKLTFQPKRKSLPQFLGELNEYIERAFGDQALQRIDSFLYAKMPPHLASSINLAYLKNGKYDQIVAHLESEVELSGIENDEQLTILTMTATVKGNNENKSDLSKTSCLHCKKLGHLTKGCRKINPKEQEQKQDTNQKKKLSHLKHTLFVHAVKLKTIHQKYVGEVLTLPKDPKNLNNTLCAVTTKATSQKAHIH